MTSLEIPDPFRLAADILYPPDDTWEPLPHQIAPAGDWFVWMLMGGRGCGKTATSARYVHDHVHGPPCLPDVPGGHWVSIVGPTLGDAVTSCVEGPSGLRAHDQGVKVTQRPGGAIARWTNGVEAKLFGANSPDDVERFRSGGNRCLVWCEEMAAWRYLEECWRHIRLGLRVGPHPRAIISTTPKNRKIIREINNKATKPVEEGGEPDKYKITHATTRDNPHLHQERAQELIADFAGTRLGQQEIEGVLLEDIENALWDMDKINRDRIHEGSSLIPAFDYVVVAVDPQGKEGGDNTGIVVAGVCRKYVPPGGRPGDAQAHAFILADYTVNGRPEVWARAAIRAYHDWEANVIIAEVNNGAQMVEHTIRTYDESIPFEEVHASRGKAVRAEPVSTLYEQHRVHHIGYFPELEMEMCDFDPQDPDPSWSPDRMDALVWAVTKLLVTAQVLKVVNIRDRRLRGRR